MDIRWTYVGDAGDERRWSAETPVGQVVLEGGRDGDLVPKGRPKWILYWDNRVEAVYLGLKQDGSLQPDLVPTHDRFGSWRTLREAKQAAARIVEGLIAKAKGEA